MARKTHIKKKQARRGIRHHLGGGKRVRHRPGPLRLPKGLQEKVKK